LSTLVKRDPKGLYAKAMRGEIENFTGVSNPYEPPERSEIKVRTDQQAVQESVASVLDWLEASGYVGNRS
jgi:adenylylsulfate kinase-like enzyme